MLSCLGSGYTATAHVIGIAAYRVRPITSLSLRAPSTVPCVLRLCMYSFLQCTLYLRCTCGVAVITVCTAVLCRGQSAAGTRGRAAPPAPRASPGQAFLISRSVALGPGGQNRRASGRKLKQENTGGGRARISTHPSHIDSVGISGVD